MKELCGTCLHCPCICLATKPEEPWEGATGAALDRLAEKVGIRRGQPVGNVGVESDEFLRARVQLSVILGQPYQSGLVCGELLDKQGARKGVRRRPGERDSLYRVRVILSGRSETASGRDQAQLEMQRRLAG